MSETPRETPHEWAEVTTNGDAAEGRVVEVCSKCGDVRTRAAVACAGGWIPVAERLPDQPNGEQRNHLVSDGKRVWLESMHSLNWNTDVAPSPMVVVTHWMPLPEPPK